ncbi:MAG: hypothetical protein NVS1B4_26830 [Gemmatimonadaceae bacterium]
MPALSGKVATAVASRLALVVPTSRGVRAEGDVVSVYSQRVPTITLCGSAAAIIAEDNDERPVDERIEVAVAAILNSVQDCVTRELGEPWPKQMRGGMALPDTRRDGRRIHLWFGDDERTPVIALPPIEIAELESPRCIPFEGVRRVDKVPRLQPTSDAV